jgi:hypothetical protein
MCNYLSVPTRKPPTNQRENTISAHKNRKNATISPSGYKGSGHPQFPKTVISLSCSHVTKWGAQIEERAMSILVLDSPPSPSKGDTIFAHKQ